MKATLARVIGDYREGGTIVVEVLAGEEGTVGEAKIIGREVLLHGRGRDDEEDRARTKTEETDKSIASAEAG